MKSFQKFFVGAVLGASFCAGCAYNPGPNVSAPGKTVPAKAGSSYTFTNYQTDTLGKPIDSTKYLSKDSVAEVGITFSGKTNVTHIISVDPITGSSLADNYINFETNGDISVYSGGGGGLGGVTLPDWHLYPVQTHTTYGLKIADTTVTMSGVPVPVRLTVFDTISYVNSGSFTNGTNSIPVFNISEVLTVDATAIVLLYSSRVTEHISFAPSLGYIVSTIADPTKSPNTSLFPTQGGSQSSLTGYVLK